MARIRTVKPEFWEDEGIGLLSRDARLLFIACFNFADDEGLLRWNPAYIRASAFMYDDLDDKAVAALMDELTDSGMVFSYIGGIAKQHMAVVVNFRKHQKVNRPQPSKLPPPPLHDPEVQRMYGRRDGWTCHVCGGDIPEEPVTNDAHNLTVTLVVPRRDGGTEHPTNVRAAHRGCVAGGDGTDTGASQSAQTPPESLTHSENNSVNGSVNHSQTNSPLERKGRGEGKEREGRERRAGERRTPATAATNDRPPLSLIPLDWQPSQDDIRAAQSARAAAGQPLLTDAQLADVTRKYVRRMRDEERRARHWGARWQEWAERERPTRPPSLPAAAGAENVVDLTGRLTGADARIAGHIALTQHLRALEAQEN